MDVEQFDIAKKTKWELFQLLKAYQRAIGINIAVIITNAHGIIIYTNKIFCKIAGYAKSDLIGRNPNILSSGYHNKEFYQGLWQTITCGWVWSEEIKNKSKDGTFNWSKMTIIPIHDDNQNIIQYLALKLPIDKRKKAERILGEQIKNLHKMMFTTSHKVRKPIATILGLMSLLGTDEIAQEDLKKYLGYLRDNVLELDNSTRELTQSIYRINKLTEGKGT